jgi:hypothetical protein
VAVRSLPVPPRSGTLLALVVSTTLGLVSCSDELGAGPPSTPTTAPTTTPAQALGPELPDDAAVRAALSDYYAAVNRAVTGRSVGALDAETTQAYDIVDAAGAVVDRVAPAQTVVVYTFAAAEGAWLVSGADDA